MTIEELILRPIIEELTDRTIRTLKQAKIRDATGKSDAQEWYAKASVYAKATRVLEALIPKTKEEYIL